MRVYLLLVLVVSILALCSEQTDKSSCMEMINQRSGCTWCSILQDCRSKCHTSFANNCTGENRKFAHNRCAAANRKFRIGLGIGLAICCSPCIIIILVMGGGAVGKVVHSLARCLCCTEERHEYITVDTRPRPEPKPVTPVIVRKPRYALVETTRYDIVEIDS